MDIALVLGTRLRRHHRGGRRQGRRRQHPANNLPVANDTAVVNGNKITVEVGQRLPRALDLR